MKLPFSGKSHIRVIKEIARGMHEAGFLNRYLEIGIRRGNCFNLIAPFAKEAYAVDVKNYYKSVKHNKNLVWFHGDSQEFLKQHNQKRKFDLVFIDGNHKFQAVLDDFRGVFPMVNNNGIILLHDTYPPSEKFTSPQFCNDCYRAADWIRKNDGRYGEQCEIVTLPFYYGISIIRKLDRQLLWLRR
ncbi:MAG: class I SAM-dependent methyltransferase [Candidatus Thorarchaeota archaeon]